MSARVLFISKPIAPPFHDGTKCLVRDIARNLRHVAPIVMSTSKAASIAAADGACPIESAAVYSGAGDFSPGLLANLRAAAFVLLGSRADVWHFVFAPNPRSSSVGRSLKALRGVPIVQTIASPPQIFASVKRILFGDVVVAQSRHTFERVREAEQREGTKSGELRLQVIPPPVPRIEPRSADAVSSMRRSLDIPEGAPVFVYPGDLETSSGAAIVSELVRPLIERIREAIVVFAYRAKTPEAPRIAARLQEVVPRKNARFVSELPDVLELIAGAAAVLFPVDDLRGKVDLPIVLLEAMDLGIPVLALDEGPLKDLQGAWRLADRELGTWLTAIESLQRDAECRGRVIEAQRRAVLQFYRDEVVAGQYEALYRELLGKKRRPAWGSQRADWLSRT